MLWGMQNSNFIFFWSSITEYFNYLVLLLMSILIAWGFKIMQFKKISNSINLKYNKENNEWRARYFLLLMITYIQLPQEMKNFSRFSMLNQQNNWSPPKGLLLDCFITNLYWVYVNITCNKNN